MSPRAESGRYLTDEEIIKNPDYVTLRNKVWEKGILVCKTEKGKALVVCTGIYKDSNGRSGNYLNETRGIYVYITDESMASDPNWFALFPFFRIDCEEFIHIDEQGNVEIVSPQAVTFNSTLGTDVQVSPNQHGAPLWSYKSYYVTDPKSAEKIIKKIVETIDNGQIIDGNTDSK